VNDVFVEHPLITKRTVEEREYQTSLSSIASKESTLIVLPTGMGKTVIALRVIAEVLSMKGGKALFLAPTKPLVEQHACFLREHLVGKKVAVMTGEVAPEERELLWLENDVIASTPQVVANDIRNERASLQVGDYAYVSVAAEYRQFPGLVLGMTASPGSSGSRIKDVCKNLGIERIEMRSESDPDVVRYVHDIQMDWVEVEVPLEMKRIIFVLRNLYDEYVSRLTKFGVVDGKRPMTRKYLLEIGNALQARSRGGEKHRNLFQAMSLQAMAIKVDHALEMAETQGATALRNYLRGLLEEASSDDGSKASRTIVTSAQFIKVQEMLLALKVEHPKLAKVMTIVSRQVNENPESRVIVFTHFRDTADLMASKLATVDGVRVVKLVGQSKHSGEKGLRQKEQVGVLDRFRSGEFNTLVATSVGEEGLDVASTDLVIFYEPVPSEIRAIQRRGRTGRKRSGRVVVLITKGTRDEAYAYASLNKEKSMKRGLAQLQRSMDREKGIGIDNEEDGGSDDAQKGQRSLSDFPSK
jgi:ERCC4-related helicase